MRRIAKLISFVVLCLFFLISVAAARPFLLRVNQSVRIRLVAQCVRLWARACLKILGMKIKAHGLSDDLRSNHYLLVSNHQSYLDVIIIASIFPTIFIAKTEVGGWPLIGWLSKLGGTIFVDREDARSGAKCAFRVSRALRLGVNVQVFPESTTGDGSTVLPFKGLFFASALRSQTGALPMTIKFQSVNGRPMDRKTLDMVCWYGEMEFAGHFWNLLNIESAEVSLMINEPIKPVRGQRAKDLAEAARERVFRSFTNADEIAAARAEVPIEFARAETTPGSEDRIGNEPGTAADFIVGALLFSLFSSNHDEPGEMVKEIIPQSENKR